MNNLTNDVIKYCGRHFVSLSCVQRKDDVVSPVVISGFVVEVIGSWVFITAGHVLEEVKNAIENGVVFDTWRFDDQTTLQNRTHDSIPYEFVSDEWLVVSSDEKGYDYAILILDHYYIRCFEAGKVTKPLHENSWGNPKEPFDRWLVMGIATESVTYDGKNELNAVFSVLPLDRAECPIEVNNRDGNQFCAKLPDMGTVKSMRGISGAPIFALRKVENTWEYYVVGVQSSWFPRSKLIVACPIIPLLREVKDLIVSVRERILDQ